MPRATMPLACSTATHRTGTLARVVESGRETDQGGEVRQRYRSGPSSVKHGRETSHEWPISTTSRSKAPRLGGVAWTQLRVSSQQSHDRLKDGMPLYRVTRIGSLAVKIFIMKHGVDFE